MFKQLQIFSDSECPLVQREREKKSAEKVKNITLTYGLPKDKNGMPIIKKTDIVPSSIVAVHEYLFGNKAEAVHTFVYDILFERLWNKPYVYMRKFKRENIIVFSPGFSTYLDMDLPYIYWNVYRNRLLGAFYQKNGVRVIPTITWAGVASYDMCFSGIEPGGIVAVGPCPKTKIDKNMWIHGFREMIKRLSPSAVIIYGNIPDIDFGVEIINFENPYINRMNNYGRVG